MPESYLRREEENPKVLKGWREKWKLMSPKSGTGREEA